VEQGLAPSYTDPHYDSRAYGAVIFAKYLSEHVGGRDSMRQVWNRVRPGGTTAAGMRVLVALDDYAVSRQFDSLEHLYLGFAGANAVMDYEEGVGYGQVPLRSTTLTASSLVDNLPVPEYLGATYLSRPSGNNQGLQVSLAGLPATTWGLAGVVERNAGFFLTVADLAVSGTPVVQLADLAAGETAFAVPSLLNNIPPASYASTEAVYLSPDGTPPGAVAVDSPTAQAGGFDLTWTPQGDPDVAGYVVRWRPSGAGSYVTSRTLFGSIAAVEVRGLDPGTYQVQVFAYDQVGNADSTSAPVPVTVDVAGSDAPVTRSGATIPNALIATVELGSTSGGDGGGGGGGCFLRWLGF
jgi:hypothetical protein